VTETLHHARPMVCLPLFWDQYDNAQRMDELGLGVRLPPYTFEARDLLDAIDRLTADEGLRDRLGQMADKRRADPGRLLAADLIQRLARERAPIRA
jgi:UDP:flavonoid glycosyltransferase YjiC (YdhE family)